jgi:16S rRNA (uracil1498-N3)-methyltransferase
VTRNRARCDLWIGCYQGLQDRGQDRILTFIVRRFIFALELDSDGKVIASRTTAKTRLSCMPGTLGEWYKLNKLAVAPNQYVRRNFHAANLSKIRVRIPIKFIQKQCLNFAATEFTGRQTYAVKNDHIEGCLRRPRVSIGAETLPRGSNQPGLRINGIFARHVHFRHDFKDMSTRLFVSGALINGAEIELDGDRARYLGKALRARVGDRVAVFNGEGPEWPATITRIGKNSVVLELGESVEAGTESPLKIHLVQGISRGERMDFVVQKATELGVKRITPVLTEYGVVKLNPDRAEKRREHWQKIAASACEQSGRTRLPLVDTPVPLKNWFGSKPEKVDAELILAPGAATPLATIGAPETKICVMIGPEGGFSDAEYEDADVSGFRAVSLGPRVLRTESAAIATLATLQSLWGDLR